MSDFTARLIKRLTRFATSAVYPLMRRSVAPLVLLAAVAMHGFAQEAMPSPAIKKRSWFARLFHPFSSRSIPQYRDQRLRGLALELLVTPEMVKLSEVRQLQVKLIVTNESNRPVTLEFPTDQRIEIYLRNSAETILTKWTDNHAINDVAGTVLINPHEHVEYNETIATRELTSNKVYAIEVFLPQYPELRIRQKIMTAP
jgi:Intracellular proteinase inhibitor